MDSRGDCVTEVLLPNLPPEDRHERLHKHLPTSLYSHGAIYAPIDDLPQSPSHSSPSTSSNQPGESTNESNPPPSAILLLRGNLQYRFGGRLERSHSPPWTWRSEALCGQPYPYYARDLHCLDAAARPKLHPHYSATYIVRLSFSSLAGKDYLSTAHLHHLPGWLAEDFYDCREPQRQHGVPGALRYVCIQSFDVRAQLAKVAARISESMSVMERHKPHLMWYMGIYGLEGSLAYSAVGEGEGERGFEEGRRSVHRPPGDSLVHRKSYESPVPEVQS